MVSTRRADHQRCRGARAGPADFIRTRFYDKYAGSMAITAHLYHISHFQTCFRVQGSGVDLAGVVT